MGCIKFLACANFTVDTAQKIKFSIKVFFSKCEVSCWFGHIYWRNPSGKTSFFCAVGSSLAVQAFKTFVVGINTAWKVSVFGIILVRMPENGDQNNSKEGHFLRSIKLPQMCIPLNFAKFLEMKTT